MFYLGTGLRYSPPPPDVTLDSGSRPCHWRACSSRPGLDTNHSRWWPTRVGKYKVHQCN